MVATLDAGCLQPVLVELNSRQCFLLSKNICIAAGHLFEWLFYIIHCFQDVFKFIICTSVSALNISLTVLSDAEVMHDMSKINKFLLTRLI